MNDTPLPEVHVRPPSMHSQADLPLATHGTMRQVWEGRFGPVLIEVAGDRVFVNGQPVERMIPAGEHAPGRFA